MSNVVNQILLSEENVNLFRKEGFLKVRNFFTSESVEAFRNLLSSQTDASSLMGELFSKVKYDVGNDNTHVQSVYKSKNFKKFINELIKERVIFTQGLYFELEQGKSLGFPWHFGLLSFNYIQPDDSAYTIWIPLDTVDPEGQRGGMEYIPEDVFSAEEDLKKTATIYQLIADGKLDKEKYLGDSFQGADDDMFGQVSREDSYEPGDIFIFNRNVWHKSIPLGEGPMGKRRAFVMRFISSKATYSEDLLDACETIGHNQYSNYGRSFKDLKNGMVIANSDYANELV